MKKVENISILHHGMEVVLLEGLNEHQISYVGSGPSGVLNFLKDYKPFVVSVHSTIAPQFKYNGEAAELYYGAYDKRFIGEELLSRCEKHMAAIKILYLNWVKGTAYVK